MNFKRSFISYLLVMNLVGCSAGSAIRGDKSFIESTTTHNRPISEPVRAMTSFSDGLNCMDKLLAEANVPQVVVAVKTIKDPSGKAPASANDMIVTSLSQMSKTSGAFKVVDFEIDPLKQDTVQNLSNLLLPTGNMTIPAPEVYISGAISFVDQNVMTKNNSLGVSVEQKGEFGISNDTITTALGMELHIGDFLTRTLYPGIDSANEIVAANKGIGFDSGARVNKTGVQFSFERNLSQGTGAAVRTLTDLGMIELIGKYAKLPYWQCLALDQSHPEFQRELLDWYEGMGEKERVKFFQRGLKNIGYYSGSINGRPNKELKEALSEFQKDNNATATGLINFETYERLMKNYVKVDASGNITKIGLKPSKGDDEENEPKNGYPYFERDMESPIGTSIALSQKSYTQGSKLEFDLQADQKDTYAACFYQDAQNSIAQIYPNPLQEDEKLSTEKPLHIPSNNVFSLDLNNKGKEGLLCVTSYSSLSKGLKKKFGEPFNPIKAKDLKDLSTQLKAKFGDSIKGEDLITYSVE